MDRSTHVVMMSENSQTPMMVWRTPRMAEDTMCDTGDVTLIDRNPAMQIMNPNTPCAPCSRRDKTNRVSD